MLSDKTKKTISVLELSSTNYWNAVENLNSHVRESVACEDGSVKVTPVDSNNTMDKVLGGLRDEVIKEARRQVELKLKAEM